MSRRETERTWESVNDGDEIVGHRLKLTATTMVSQVSGSQDWNYVHHDERFAQESGHPGIFYNTGWTAAMLSRGLTDWAGPTGFVRKLDFQMRRMNRNGDTATVKGVVTGKRIEGEEHLVDIEIWIENDREGVTTPGTAVVRLAGGN